jgi:predicted Zn-dependent protease
MKDALHEIGHTEELRHYCSLPITYQSLTVSHADSKTGEYCDECQLEMH